jgi:hypothetical protein
MTMQINSRRTIAGIPILEVRRFFRRVVAHHHDSFDKEWLLRELRLSEAQGDQVLEELVTRGFVSIKPSQATTANIKSPN